MPHYCGNANHGHKKPFEDFTNATRGVLLLSHVSDSKHKQCLNSILPAYQASDDYFFAKRSLY